MSCTRRILGCVLLIGGLAPFQIGMTCDGGQPQSFPDLNSNGIDDCLENAGDEGGILKIGETRILTVQYLFRPQASASGTSTLDFSIFVSTDSTLSGDDTLLIRSTGDVIPFQQTCFSFLITVPSEVEPGSYFLISVVDPDNTVAEVDEDNNVSVAAITIIDPCLYVVGDPENRMDCNHNDRFDDCDIAEGVSHDLNSNGVPDECDILLGDCNSNGIPDDADISIGTSHDCNMNGIPDECDLAEGDSKDCNHNSIPDECDIRDGHSQDCNSNGIPDECDIAASHSLDCNANGVPDECDIAASHSLDCNANGVPDECDILTEDCNTNGIPDVCDIASSPGSDCNANGLPDECDLASGGSLDCNTNGRPDECDVSAGVSLDANSNGVPDECELDCNTNGVPDGDDISGGASQDCNGNGIPDECDLVSGDSLDCNGNLVPDACDISAGASLDCNANQVPDDCDIRDGTSLDCNTNGIPDSCDLSGGSSLDCNVNAIPDECETDCNANGVPDDCDIASGGVDCNGNSILDECEGSPLVVDAGTLKAGTFPGSDTSPIYSSASDNNDLAGSVCRVALNVQDLRFQWELIQRPVGAQFTIVNPNVLTTPYLISSAVAGNYVFQLTVTDTISGQSVSDTVTLVLTAAPSP